MNDACGLCRRQGHTEAACPSNPANWPDPFPDTTADEKGAGR